MEEEKSWTERMGENPEGGRVYLSKKDKGKILESYYDHEKSLTQKIRESEFFMYGILFAILGSYLATGVYDLINGKISLKGFNFIVLGIFILVFFRFWVKLNEEKINLKLSKDSLEKWTNADYIDYGRTFKPLTREKGDEMMKEMKLAKSDLGVKEIHDKYFYPEEKERSS